MLQGKDVLVIGARTGGYGDGIARAAVESGARVFGTTLNPKDPNEQAYFESMGAILLDVPLKYDVDRRDELSRLLSTMTDRLKEHGVQRLHAVAHAVAGGFPRQPSVMKAVGEILRGKQVFSDLATWVKRNVYYVNAGSFADTVDGLSGLIDSETHLMALTYRGSLPYFISDTKTYLERLASRMADEGKRTVLAALPEAWTQSSQFFTGIEIAVFGAYLEQMRGRTEVAQELRPAFFEMEQAVGGLERIDEVIDELQVFIRDHWSGVSAASNPGELFNKVQDLFTTMRGNKTFATLRRAVEIISDYVREASGFIAVRDFLSEGRYQPGDVRQVYYGDLLGGAEVKRAEPAQRPKRKTVDLRDWVEYDRDYIREILYMYGDNFLFMDRVFMQSGELKDGSYGFCSFTVPSPEENPIMRDHFVDMPLFGGHLQMEAVAQFGTFIVMNYLKGKKMVPILTGTEFPDLNTMAPPGEKLTILGKLHVPEKRYLTFEAIIENRFARSKGVVRGMIVSERVVKKMMSAFNKMDD